MANARRPPAPLEHADEKQHRRILAERANVGLPMDGSDSMKSPLILKSYTVSTLPAASLWADGVITVSDETGGHTMAFSDGTNWRRVTDRAVVS